MDCRTCEPTLIDLVHSELATDAAREAHAHLATCASCRASFETLVAATKLAAQLPLVEPPPHIATRVMELAEAHARDVAARQRVVAPQPTPWQALLDFVGRLATRPQVAMATIMVLIVAVGFWSLPRLRRQASPPVAGVVVNPEPDGEAAPGTGVEPAERLDLKVDMRARRIRSKDGLPAPAAAAPSAVAAAPQPAGNEVLAERDKSSDDPLAALDDVDLGDVGRKQVAEKPARHALGGLAVGAGSARELAQGPATSAPAKAAAPAPQLEASKLKLRKGEASTTGNGDALARADEAQLRGRAEGVAIGERSAASTAEPEAKYATKSKPSAPLRPKLDTESSFAQAPPPAAPAEAAAPAAEPAPAASQAAPSPADLLTSARAHAKRSGCLAATPDYQRLVTRAPNSAEAGSALIELAQCRRISGDVAGARSLLKRAAEIPEVAGRARALLADLPPGK